MLRSLRCSAAANLFWLSVVACTACGSTPPTGERDAAVTPDAGPDAGVDAGECVPPDDDPFGCENLTPDPTCPAHWVVGAVGRVTRTDATPVENARAQLCVRLHPDDRLVCLFPPTTDADGRFAIVVPRELRCLTRAAMRAVAPDQPLATTYCPIEFEPGNEPIVDLGPYVLQSVEAATVPPLGDPAALREVALAGGVVLEVAPESFPSSSDYEALAGGPVDVAATQCFANGLALESAYAFSPEVPLDPGAAVRLPNTTGLAPGTVVNLHVLGGLETRLADGTAVEEAELANFGTGVVSGDGSSIVADAMDGRLPYLSWLLVGAP